MTMEKILIFGFAIAAIGALTTLATDMSGDRSTAVDGYRSGVDDLVERAR